MFPILSHVNKSKNQLYLINNVPQMVPLWPMTALLGCRPVVRGCSSGGRLLVVGWWSGSRRVVVRWSSGGANESPFSYEQSDLDFLGNSDHFEGRTGIG